MAVINDMIPPFELVQPASVDEAVSALSRAGEETWVLAGGQDSFDWFKERVKRPEVVVDLGGIAELTSLSAGSDGLEIGAMVTLTELSRHPGVRDRYGVLAEAAGLVASPQIRNQGTVGGNVCQDVRCWYYRSGWPCYRAGGNVCYADSPTAMNREHCILGADRCVAVNPSDVATALLALGATMVVRSPDGEREIPAEKFWMGPGTDITRVTVLEPDEILTSIRVSPDFAGARFYYEKVADRKVWDFPLMNVASSVVVSGGVIERLRLAVNGVAPTPLRLTEVERAVVGNPVNERTEELAGRLAVRNAESLRHNDYKIALMKNLVKRAVRGGEAA